MDQRTGRHGIEHRTVLLALSKFAGIHFETGVDTSRIVGERQSLGYRDKISWNGNNRLPHRGDGSEASPGRSGPCRGRGRKTGRAPCAEA